MQIRFDDGNDAMSPRAARTHGWWHELNCRDVRAAIAFYGRTLGWRFDEITLADGSRYHIARRNGRPMCGLFEIIPHLHGDIPDHWMPYMQVSGMQTALRTTRVAGGEVLRPPLDIPGLGRLALIADAASAIIGLIEPHDAPLHALDDARPDHDASLRPLSTAEVDPDADGAGLTGRSPA